MAAVSSLRVSLRTRPFIHGEWHRKFHMSAVPRDVLHMRKYTKKEVASDSMAMLRHAGEPFFAWEDPFEVTKILWRRGPARLTQWLSEGLLQKKWSGGIINTTTTARGKCAVGRTLVVLVLCVVLLAQAPTSFEVKVWNHVYNKPIHCIFATHCPLGVPGNIVTNSSLVCWSTAFWCPPCHLMTFGCVLPTS